MPTTTIFYSTHQSELSVDEPDFTATVNEGDADFVINWTADINTYLDDFKMRIPVSDSQNGESNNTVQPLTDLTADAYGTDEAEAKAMRTALLAGTLAGDASPFKAAYASGTVSDYRLAFDELFAGIGDGENTAAHQQLSNTQIEAYLGSADASAWDADGEATSEGFFHESDATKSVFSWKQCEDLLDGIRLGGRYDRSSVDNDSHRVHLVQNDVLRIPVQIQTETGNNIVIMLKLTQSV